MKKIVLLIALAIFLFSSACKKNNLNNNSGNSGILENGPLSPKLGKRIQLRDYGLPYSYFWGRTSNELFISAESNLLRIDLSAEKVKALESSGTFTGKTNENSGIIFVGTKNGNYGYYEYNFATDAIAGLVPLSINSVSNFYMAGNTVIFYTGISTNTTPSACQGLSPWDYCWQPSSNIASLSLYHIDKLTKQFTRLPGRKFKQFSKDGSKSIFYDNFNVTNVPVYLFDNMTKQFTDSFTMYTPYSDASITPTYYDVDFKSYYHENSGSGFEVIMANAKTNQEMERYSLNVIPQFWGVYPANGLIVYVATPVTNSTSFVLGIYNMKTRQSKTITTLSTGESSLIGGIIPSDDNKKLLIRYLNDLYIKEIY
jgi:hypothetical protein